MKAAPDIVQELKAKLIHDIDISRSIDDDELRSMINDIIGRKFECSTLSVSERLAISKDLFNALRGLDVLQDILEEDGITEIMINGPDNIFVEKEGTITRYPASFSGEERLCDVIQTIVAAANKRVNESSPIVDTRLSDGSRVNVVLPPVSTRGPIVTVRRFPKNPMTIEDLIRGGSITEQAAHFLGRAVESGCNIFISGGTGSGKTTFLGALCDLIPEGERIITIEDSAELQIKNIENLVSLECRPANAEGDNEISIRDLIRTSLRMRPDRIIVGEVRGAEAFDMLQAMNTGHDGSLSTGHANSTRDMLSRLEMMVLTAAEIPLAAIHAQIASALDIIIHLSRARDGSRRVMEITEVGDVEKGEIQLNTLFKYTTEGGLVSTGRALSCKRRFFEGLIQTD